VYSGVGVRRGIAKRAGIWGNFRLCWRGPQTVGALRMKIVSTPSEQAIWGIIATVSEVKKEIPAEIFRRKLYLWTGGRTESKSYMPTRWT
jgi:hypothetical protein